MQKQPVRTRFAPSPTGFMHIGNLRTALYEYLIARSQNGAFVLRIEDTDQKRLVEGALDHVYSTLKRVGLEHDEGPDVGGPHAPYVQSERLATYPKKAQELLQAGKAYRCFCSRERLEGLRSDDARARGEMGYDRHCRDLSQATIERHLEQGTPHVIRQKMPLEGQTTFEDAVFGTIEVDNSELEDQILIKSDGYPTYNFANVIDDHAMQITHVVRGSEYLSSTPKYNLLYEAFGWQPPVYVHLPLIVGEDGRKLSKRHGSVSFRDLLDEGYLPEAIVNYIALLGWSPQGNQERFSLEELCQHFRVDQISKSPSVFDHHKLTWFNEAYLRDLSDEAYIERCRPFLLQAFKTLPEETSLLAGMLRPRVSRLTDIPGMVGFLASHRLPDPELYAHKKSKSTLETAAKVLPLARQTLQNLDCWDHDGLYQSLKQLSVDQGLKAGQVMWPVRIAVSGQAVTPGGAIEILQILGRQETDRRLKAAIDRLEQQ